MNRTAPCFLCCLACAGLASLAPFATPAPQPPVEDIPSLSAADAVQWGLQRNPELIALRQQHGIAAGAVVIAETYPFNPIYEVRIRPSWGPPSAGVTNAVDSEHTVLIEVECHGQGGIRRTAAGAGLSRTDWDIAAQELNLAVRVLRAFDTVLYRSEKRRVLEDMVQLNQKAATQVEELVKAGRPGLRPADQIIIRTEVQDSLAQVGPGIAAQVAASQDLRRVLGVVDEPFRLHGRLENPPVPGDAHLLQEAALERRPEMYSAQRRRPGSRCPLAFGNRQSLRQRVHRPHLRTRPDPYKLARRHARHPAAGPEPAPRRNHAAPGREDTSRTGIATDGSAGAPGRPDGSGAAGSGPAPW